MENPEKKKCLYCAEEILFQAIICKHCGNKQVPSISSGFIYPENFCALGLIISFFLPWAQLMGFGASGYDLTKIGSYGNLGWGIPIFALLTIANSQYRAKATNYAGVMAGFYPFLLVLEFQYQNGFPPIPQEIFHIISIGGYLTALFSLGIIYFSLQKKSCNCNLDEGIILRKEENEFKADKIEGKQITVAGKRVVLFLVFLLLLPVIFYCFKSAEKQIEESRSFQKERSKLSFSKILTSTGIAYYNSSADWKRVSNDFSFNKEQGFKTEKESFVVLGLPLENEIKVFPNSELVVLATEMDGRKNLVKREKAFLDHGEVTVCIALDGRDVLEIEAGGVVALGKCGLFKVLFNSENKVGEVVVKNGLVELYRKDEPQKRKILSAFNKIVFSNEKCELPQPASIIQYEWK